MSRRAEGELFPALRELGMRFYAYNPLAGGILTGKYADYADMPSDGRFTILPYYRDRYWKKSLFDAVGRLSSICRGEGIEIAAASLRWLAYHSYLDPSHGDGIIVGASSLRIGEFFPDEPADVAGAGWRGSHTASARGFARRLLTA